MPGFLVPGPPVRLCVGLTCVLSLWNTVSAVKGEAKKEKPMTFLPTTDFTALLVDIIGNSTSYLTEIFKSTSILSVSQTNESDCTFICVMTGKSGRNLSDFWDMAEKSPVINYTFTSSTSGVPGESPGGTAVTSKLTPTGQQTQRRTSRLHGTQNTRAPAPRTSPWTETTPAEGEQPVSTDRIPELHARATATATQGSSSPTLPALATRMVAKTPRVTTSTQAWNPTLSMPWAPAGPPWKTLTSTPTTATEAEAMRSLSGPPARTAATHGNSSQVRPTSASDMMYHSCSRYLPVSSSTLGKPPLRVLTLTQFGVLTALRGTSTPGTRTPSPTKAPAPKYPQTGDLPAAGPFIPGEEPAPGLGPHQVSRCPQWLLEEGAITTAPLTLAIQKLNPCLMELCRFFQQCLCMSGKREARTEAMRYCLEYYAWFLKNATRVCQRVERVPHSHTLKQKCLQNICQSV
ncbi:HERV-H LTR-associating protein 1 [Ailuropoda melanoleuca]|uniref:HERV-H LTR-associating protein 1 n=1 Tax=Ailuropoda melanoleuca TaxID=9646 RepID=UPI001494ACAC|nr:HERV-H LTR-associating protein 1 [Ailuropoda melanoleuca]